MGLAIAIVAVLALGSMGLTGIGVASPAARSSPAAITGTSLTAGPTSGAYAAQTAAGAAGACYQKSIDLPASIASAAASYVTPSGTHAPPLFNAQVQPYAIYTGPYGYVSAGAAMRDQGYGHIQLTWSGTLVAAYMVWSIMANSVPAATATLNNVTLTGTWTAFATPSPCWSPTYIYTFVAAVSGLIVNGGNQLTNFPSGITDGSSPWAAAQTNPMLEGASLVAIYNSSSPSTQQVTLYTGALTTVAGSISAPLNYTPTVSTSARTTFMVADGQLAGNTASWNGAVVDSNAFPGSDPRTSTAVWSYGNLYDTKTYAVNVLAGSNSTTAGINAGGTGDCITWIGQVLSVVVAGQPAPYVVTFQEQGLSSGSNWQVTTAGTTHTAIVSALRPSSIQFSLGNGSYSYTIGAMPGFTTQYSGSYQIAGGSVYILVPFHPITYTINFTETGLPSSPSWWVDLTNTTQGFASNLTVYTTYITFAVPNGTYHFFVGAYNTFYIARPGSGSVVIAGSNVAVPISIPPPPLYRITFSETGLPRGTSWGGSTDTSWGDYTNTTVAPASFSILLPNTTNDVIYPTTVPGYAVPYNILFTVSGAAKTVAVNYQQVFSVYFNTTSLPASVSWEIVVSNANYSFTGTSGTGGLHNITISAPNGTYSFTVYPGSSIYTAHPTTGSVTVSGAKVVVLIAFTHPPFYTLTVVENGLPNGTSWTGYVNTGVGDTDVPTTQSSFTLQLPNTTGSVYGYANAQFNQPSVSLSITGGPTTTYLNFSRYWTVTFPVSGLANETFYLVQIYNASTKVYVGEGEGDSGYGGAYFASIGLLNGKYTVEPVATGYTAVPSAVNMTVAGHGMVFPVAFIPTGTHAVTFNALSLPMGVNWIVVLGTQWQNATWSSMTFGVASGTYSYTVQGSAGYTPSPASGSVTVSATALSVNITFGGRAPTTYAVTFTETGLPGGATWYVNISGQASLSATVGVTGVHAMAAPGAGTLISTSLANGTYSYQVATNEKSWATTATGGFTVNGSPIVVPNFAFRLLTYAVTFAETGLPLSSSWGVTINGSLYSATTPSSVSTTLPNGTYTYAINGFAGFHQTTLSYHGTVTVAGSAVTEPTLVFTPFHWVLTFTESGLPSGTLWYLNVSGQTSTSSTTTTNVIGLANGTYAYTLASSDKRYATNPVSGGFTVAGAPVGLSARYALYTYTVTFNETGLPAGTNWAVTFNGVPSSSTATSILFTSIPNGTYSFTASASGYTATPASGSLSIAKHLGQTVAFAVNLGYAVSFNETGLPASTMWGVIFGGTLQGSTASTITFFAKNGTYPYTLGVIAGMQVSPRSGTVTVSGASTTVAITFSALSYAVAFTEVGLVTGTSWSVTLNSVVHTSTTNSISFAEMPGTYSYTIGATPGRSVSPSSGTLTVGSAAVSVPVVFSTPTYTVTFTETGTSTAWAVQISGGPGPGFGVLKSSTSSSISFTEPNGSYTYVIGTVAGLTASPSSGTVTVAGNAPTVSIAFSAAVPPTYSLQFTENGLVAGTSWSATVAGVGTMSSTGNSITFNGLVSATYTYTFGAVTGYSTPAGGSVSITTASLSLGVSYTAPMFTVTFTESGLPTGTLWAVFFNGQIQVSTSTGITFSAPSGTWSYTIGVVRGYTVSPASGALTVSGAPTGVSVTYSPIPSNPLAPLTAFAATVDRRT